MKTGLVVNCCYFNKRFHHIFLGLACFSFLERRRLSNRGRHHGRCSRRRMNCDYFMVSVLPTPNWSALRETDRAAERNRQRERAEPELHGIARIISKAAVFFARSTASPSKDRHSHDSSHHVGAALFGIGCVQSREFCSTPAAFFPSFFALYVFNPKFTPC
jgi:hypothetical protein